MHLTKTLKIKIAKLTTTKRKLLEKEIENFNKFLRGENPPLYSATTQQAQKLKKKLRKVKNKLYALTIRNDTFKIIKTNSKLFPYFLKVPIYGKWGGIKLPLICSEYHLNLLKEINSFGDSQIFKKGNEFYLHLTIKKPAPKSIKISKKALSLISIDLGERNPAVSVILQGNSMIPTFNGNKSLRRIRGHYRYLRRRLGKKKLLNKIKSTAKRESRIIRDQLHKISKQIINQAQKLKQKGRDVLIVLGNLKNIRTSAKNKGKRMRRRINQWTFYKLSQFIKYKANWLSIPVFFIPEYRTSKTCHKCKNQGTRRKSLFKCSHCSLEYNADINGAINIGTRLLEYTFGSRGTMTCPLSRTVKAFVFK